MTRVLLGILVGVLMYLLTLGQEAMWIRVGLIR